MSMVRPNFSMVRGHVAGIVVGWMAATGTDTEFVTRPNQLVVSGLAELISHGCLNFADLTGRKAGFGQQQAALVPPANAAAT